MLLLHGTADSSVPFEIAVEFGNALKVTPVQALPPLSSLSILGSNFFHSGRQRKALHRRRIYYK